MKKRSLLAISLVSLVGLVGCGKQASGAAAKCSGAAFDDIVFAQYGVFYGSLVTTDYFDGTYEPYNFCVVSYDISNTFSGYYAEYYGVEDGYSESNKGSFEDVTDEDGYWMVNPDADYSEEELEEYEYILDQWTYLGYFNNYSWFYLNQYQIAWGAYLEEEAKYYEDDDSYDLSVSFTTAPSYTISESSVSEYTEDPQDEESDPVLLSRETIKGKTSVEFNDKYGSTTKESSSTEKVYEDFTEDGLSGKMTQKYSLSYKYKFIPAEEPEDDLGD